MSENLMRHAQPSEYTLIDGLRIVRVKAEKKGAYLWCIRDGFGMVMRKSGGWEDERSPSNHDEHFDARCRFESALAAYMAWTAEAIAP